MKVCVILLNYSFKKANLCKPGPLELLQGEISIHGLEELNEMLKDHFPDLQDIPGDGLYAAKSASETCSINLRMTMTTVTEYLSCLDQIDFAIVSSTVDGSEDAGIVYKTYTWTLQK